MKAIQNLRLIAIAEGISFLVLLLIAMPLKYMLDWPYAVKYIGWAHGVLFILYIVAALAAIKPMRWNIFGFGVAMIASLLPAGTFILDRSLRRRQQELQQQQA